MANKELLEVGLSFSADTSKAKQALIDLKNDISSLYVNTNTSKNGVLSQDLEHAVNTAKELRKVLENATDVNTGKLNLTEFTRGLDKAGLSLKQCNTELIKIGGNDAMNNLLKQIMNTSAETDILTGSFKKFFQGLKNTAMWTIQSNAIHAVEGALSGAYSYAQKLNKALTDINIVSDLSATQLAAVAKNANKAAKELSTTTNEYLKGALIYYQQGLSEEEVNKRTATTIKMANASGESADAISSYMTAVWNNFYDGSKSVEYYADVISKLGAATAATNAEIAEGMQSFAPIAQNVGLSYEYAASALTTVVSITRKSASEVGNAFKTIFSRLEGLQLGETLEDGVDLNKYSSALAKVGVQVLDANGDLRDMNSILDDLAIRWDTLTQAEQVALAETVGGVRQYSNLIALLNNYGDFKNNVNMALNSEGELNAQADEYAASWEAASNRVQAA